MNNQDYEQKKRECWEEYLNTETPQLAAWNKGHAKEAFDSAFDRAYSLGKQECKEEVGEEIYNLFREKVQNNEFLAIPDNPSVLDRYLEWSKVFKWTVSALGKKFGNPELSDTQETVISGWVCRDKYWDKDMFASDLFLAMEKPDRHEEWKSWVSMGAYIPLNSELFPDLTWDSDPIEVELIIKIKDE